MKKFKLRVAATVLIIIVALSLLSILGAAYQPAEISSVVQVIKFIFTIGLIYISHASITKIWRTKSELLNNHKNQYNYGKQGTDIENCDISKEQSPAPT